MYKTDLTDFQWQVVQEILPYTRNRKHSLQLIVNALLCWAFLQQQGDKITVSCFESTS